MSNVFQKALKLLVGTDISAISVLKPERPLKVLSERELIQLESQIGAQLFGPVSANGRREFFCLDKDTWIWHEEWIDIETGKEKSMTTRYEVHDKGILKVQTGIRYNFIEGEELDNLLLAVQMYREQIAREVYRRDPRTGKKLA